MRILYLFSLLLATIPFNSHAQCPGGEVELEIIIETDNYGYEGYWEVVPGGNNCGSGTIDSGGNDAVGCNGAGDQNQTPGGYGNNDEITVGPYCVTEDGMFDLHYIDDWGDGGFVFHVLVEGFEIAEFTGIGEGGVYSFQASVPVGYDLAVTGSNLLEYVETGDVEIGAVVHNGGTETITSFDLNYAIDDGEVQTSTIISANLSNNDSETFTHPILWTISENGTYDVEIWASNINGGNADQNPDNDVYATEVEAGPGIPNIIDEFIDTPVQVSQIAGPSEGVNAPTDLDFHPVLNNKELWVTNKDTENSGGSTVTIMNAGEEDQTEFYKSDGNSWHFMSLPTGIAFSENGNFATSPGVYDANHNGPPAFTGPSLWDSDLDVYAEPSGGNGSHIDMLHESPNCQGIASETDNVFWVFDGYNSDVVRYDFVDDHGPGNDYHSDAIIRRYSDDEVMMDTDEEIVSHLVLDGNNQWLYVVDHGNQRIFRIDINTGSASGTPSYGPFEALVEYSTYSGYTQESVVTSGLDKPAGIDVVGDRMIVSEFESGEIIIYDISAMPAVELDRFETGFNSVQGIKIGPNGNIWGVDHNSSTVFKATPELFSSTEELNVEQPRLYPNPATDQVTIDRISSTSIIRIFSPEGKLVQTTRTNGNRAELSLSNLSKGIYTVQVMDGQNTFVKRVAKL